MVNFVQPSLISNTTQIIGGKGANTVADLRKVRVMHTTTGLSYIIVVGNSSSTNVTKTVSALPLIDKRQINPNSSAWQTDPGHGVLANKNDNPGVNIQTFYNTTVTPNLITGRGFEQLPQTSSDLLTQSSQAAQVGAGIAPGNILDIKTYKDAVYISIDSNGSTCQPGILYSKALFDQNGAIKGWTPWAYEACPLDTAASFYGISYQPQQGQFFAVQGESADTADIVISTTWSPGTGDDLLGGTSDGSNGFNALIETAFQNIGGVVGLFDFPINTVGFTTTTADTTSLMVATGNQTVVLAETGFYNGTLDYFAPRIGSFAGTDNKNFTNGTIDTAPTTNTSMITMSGGALANLGAITSAIIIKETTYGGYLVIGGTGGLAVLRATNGHGWSPDLQKSFNSINGFSWVALGNYSNIRKLAIDGQNLYVLTNQTFDRIPAVQLQGNTLTPYTLATQNSFPFSLYCSFSDMVVSGNFAALATSTGLYTTGTGGVIATGTTTSSALWTSFAFSQGPYPVTRLIPFTSTGFEYDLAKNGVGGELDVLASFVGQGLTTLYRLTVSDATGGVTNTTIQNIPDGIIANVAGPYANFGQYQNFYSTDGGLFLISRSQYLVQPTSLESLPIEMGLGVGYIARHATSIPFITGPSRVASMVRNSALGSWIIPTNNAMQILE